VIHRDIKPSNILLAMDGTVKVVDFGTAHCRFEGRESETVSMVLGARAYLAPERLDGGEDRPQGDVYSLAHVLYELLTGRPMQVSLHPFHHGRMLAGQYARMPLQASDHALRERVTRLLERMSEYIHDDRADHAEVVTEIDAILTDFELEHDLEGFAGKHVHRRMQNIRSHDAHDHAAWLDLAFLEGPPPEGDLVDRALRDYLTDPNWHADKLALERVLARPGWTIRPFTELLDQDGKPWWQFWAAPRPLSETELRRILEVLARRRSPTVTAYAQRYLDHPDSYVRALAAELSAE